MDDPVLLGEIHLPNVEGERHTAFLPKMPEERQFFGGGGVAAQGKHRAVAVAEDIMVGIEPGRAGSDDIEKLLGERLGGFLARRRLHRREDAFSPLFLLRFRH